MDKKITKRLWVLLIMVAVGFSSVLKIPHSGQFQESRLTKNLPEKLGGRVGQVLRISEKEREVLADDTTFSRKRYFDTSLLPLAPIDVSIVFSGKDINNSIHRPEICLKAQGWNFVSERYVKVEINNTIAPIDVKEIVCIRPRSKEHPLGYLTTEGEIIYDKRVQYYTFVGKDVIVAGHYERTWADIKTRLLEGSDQQWAYITFSVDVTADLYEKNVLTEYQSKNLVESREILNGFVADLIPVMLK